ncbi:golgin-45 [Drosophila sulfurigaster albostrigata]|uniref:golgin-45 n=1 Tax=Drosophila sulfurigaster albostrigata TaxID=89887 RepID=UPI002D219217|nr:golgin-45 [Drosophila sulfurigaster albostrigata]
MESNALVNTGEKAQNCRTSGDGMEQTEIIPSTKVEENQLVSSVSKRPQLSRKDSTAAQEAVIARKTSSAGSTSSSASLPLPGLHSLYRRTEIVSRSLGPAMPKGELVQLKPRLVSTSDPLPEHKKTKPPKFIPYEPYPGAVNPMTETQQRVQRVGRNNIDIAVLAEQVSSLRTQELNPNEQVEGNSEQNAANSEDLQQLKEQLTKVQAERDYLHAQHKFQTQVNGELKSLLVASVGEDLQTKVNVLTEDKLQLARALLDTANNLTTHTEQIEFLANQCEVWRSKFLASSVMVEELARWKADLTHKNQMLNESTKQLLHATHQIREIQLDMLKQLKFLAKIRYLNLPATDVISLSSENLNILQRMVLHSGVGIPETTLKLSSASTSPLCEAEKYAVQALEFISQPLMATDEAIRALFGQVQRPPCTLAGAPAHPELDSLQKQQ